MFVVSACSPDGEAEPGYPWRLETAWMSASARSGVGMGHAFQPRAELVEARLSRVACPSRDSRGSAAQARARRATRLFGGLGAAFEREAHLRPQRQQRLDEAVDVGVGVQRRGREAQP